MACLYGNGIVICGVPVDNAETLKKRYLWCPTDECTTEMVVRDEGWYGLTKMCCKCGDSWSDGERLSRPFKPGWRAERVRKYRQLWDIATFGRFTVLDYLFEDEDVQAEG